MRNPILQIASRRDSGQHPGLLLQRYLTKDAAGDKGNPEQRHALLKAAIGAARAEPLRAIYQQAFSRWNDSFPNDASHREADLRTEGRLIIGLGSENVLEAGIRLHHTYGLPMISGSALKGLASHYCDHCWGQWGVQDPPGDNRLFRRKEKGSHHELLFGTTHDGGVIAFHDAWITPESLREAGLMLDVMTPHHPAWQIEGGAPPTDFDNPAPVPFLSVSGTFRVRVSWAGPRDCQQAEKWTDLAFCLLKEALAEWGIGGKTSSGYGRLVPRAEESMSAAPASGYLDSPAASVTSSPVAPVAPLVSAASAVSSPPGGGQAAAKKPMHKPGQRITVTRIADPKGKDRRWFAAKDGFGGVVTGQQPPEIELGQTLEVEVAAVLANGYNFRLPRPGQPQRRSNPGGGHRRT